jgi:hypothetical protein
MEMTMKFLISIYGSKNRNGCGIFSFAFSNPKTELTLWVCSVPFSDPKTEMSMYYFVLFICAYNMMIYLTCICQIYTFAGVEALLAVLPDIWDSDEKVKVKASVVLQTYVEEYGITEHEWKVLAEDTESVDRLKAILVMEHNKVSSEAGKTTKYQMLQHIRMVLTADYGGAQHAKLEDIKLEDIPKKRVSEFATWCGLKKTAMNSKIKLALLSEKNFALLITVMENFKGNRLEGQKKVKKKVKGSADDQEDEAKQPEMPTTGIDELVNVVNEEGITMVLQDLIIGKMQLKAVSQWVRLWSGKKSKFILLLFLFLLSQYECFGFYIMLYVM